MLLDPLFDRFVRRLRLSRRGQPNIPETRPRKPNSRQPGSGILTGANNFVMNQPTLVDIENQNIHNVQNQTIQNFAAGKSVLERIVPYTDLDAAMDSSARFPPPSCHPKTRSTIKDRLFSWLMDNRRQWNMLWLHGPAGTGKSAVAQNFAERCAEHGRLGASFFFSRPNERNNPGTVIPSLIYQLAVRLPHYKSLVTAQLANDPELLRKARRVLFKLLIVDPLSELQEREQTRIREPLLIVLDGLDECEGEDAQRDILEIIGEVVRLKPDFPLVWLICSRPEVHLKYLFSRADFTVSCGREKLVIDAESIADVDLYLCDGLAGIRDHFGDVTTPTWPSEQQLSDLSQKASGHFGFASTALRYIGDLNFAAPMTRLDDLLSFLSGTRVGTSNPLDALDALYTGILLGVSDEVLPTVNRILGFRTYLAPSDALVICNFPSIDQATFYRAVRKLHSVIDVPSAEVTSDKHLQFYHASFGDYLRDPSRSGRFAISRDKFCLDFAKLCLSWCKTDLALFHTTDGLTFNESHSHGILPGLTWVSDDNRARISYEVAELAEGLCWIACNTSQSEWDEALLSQIQHFDFRYIRKDRLGLGWYYFVQELWNVDSTSGIVRTEPRSEVDLQLLEYMKSMIEPVLTCRPIPFPYIRKRDSDGGEYFFIGYNSEAIVCWTTPYSDLGIGFGALNSNEAPSQERIDAYQAGLTLALSRFDGFGKSDLI